MKCKKVIGFVIGLNVIAVIVGILPLLGMILRSTELFNPQGLVELTFAGIFVLVCVGMIIAAVAGVNAIGQDIMDSCSKQLERTKKK